MKLKKIEYDRWYYPKKDRTIVNYILNDIDIQDYIKSIFDFIKKRIKYKNIILDLSVSWHDDEFNNEYSSLENMIKDCDNKLDYKLNNLHNRQVLVQINKKDFTFLLFEKIIMCYSGITLYYNFKNTDCDYFFKNITAGEKRKNVSNYESITIADYSIIIRTDTNNNKSNIDNDIEKLKSVLANYILK